jgi:hypothetical protein
LNPSASPSLITLAIRRRGFRKWYERELIRSHANLVLLLLCTLAAIGAMEALFGGGGRERLLLAACLLVAAGLGVWSMRRYLFHLSRAELLANQASCPQCQAYARWDIERDVPGDDAADRPSLIEVRCRACGRVWPIEW